MSKDGPLHGNPYRSANDEYVPEEIRFRQLVEDTTGVPCTEGSIKKRSWQEAGWAATLVGVPWMVVCSVAIEWLLKHFGLLPQPMYLAILRGGPICFALLFSCLAFSKVAKRSRRSLERTAAKPHELLVMHYRDRLDRSEAVLKCKRVVERASEKEGAISIGEAQPAIQEGCKALEGQLTLHVQYGAALLARLRTELLFWSLEAEKPRILQQVLVTTAELDERLAALEEFEACIPPSVNTASIPVLDVELHFLEERLALLPAIPPLVQEELQKKRDTGDDGSDYYITEDMRRRMG